MPNVNLAPVDRFMPVGPPSPGNFLKLTKCSRYYHVFVCAYDTIIYFVTAFEFNNAVSADFAWLEFDYNETNYQ